MTRSGCVTRDTAPEAWRGGIWLGLVAAALVLAGAAQAEPRELRAAVVWTRADLIYVAAPDSGELLAGMSLWIVRGKRELASAVITQLLEPRLAVARLDSGSLAHEKRFDKLHVRGEAAVVPRVALLRVGLPGGGRTNLLFACAGSGVAPRLGTTSYVADSSAPGSHRLVRAPDPNDAALAPDTLRVRLYADAADEEIALERGELDVAVFWPGELSARMRGDARWRDAPRGVRARGVLVAVAAATDTSSVPLGDLTAMNREVFGGDLVPWSELEPPPSPPGPAPPARWRADSALPGARVLERVLARGAPAAGARSVRLSYLDVPLAAHDSVQSGWRTPGVTPAFAIGCPVLAGPAARGVVAGLGAGAFANLVTCAGGTP